MKKLLNLTFFVLIVFIFTSKLFASEEKIEIGLLLPLTGQNQEIGKSVLRSVNLAINKIDDPILEIYPKNNFDNPDDNIKAAQELYNQGVRIFIGPIFDKNIILAGKTGTTQINYATDRVEYVSSFVGYFPANNPKYSCIVVISKPNKAIGYYGNKVAAPVFKKIAKSVINNLPNELKLNIDDINRLSDLMNQPSDNTKVLDKS